MNTPREWEEEFEEIWKPLVKHNPVTLADKLVVDAWNGKRTQLKSFIRTILDKAREDAVREHDAKWHPINENFTMENCHSAVEQAVEEERERVRKLVDGQKYDEDEEDLGAEAIADHAYKDKFEAFRYGYNQALSDIITALNEKEV